MTNHLAVGDVNIGLAEYEKKGSTEVAYRNPKVLLPEGFFKNSPDHQLRHALLGQSEDYF